MGGSREGLVGLRREAHCSQQDGLHGTFCSRRHAALCPWAVTPDPCSCSLRRLCVSQTDGTIRDPRVPSPAEARREGERGRGGARCPCLASEMPSREGSGHLQFSPPATRWQARAQAAFPRVPLEGCRFHPMPGPLCHPSLSLTYTLCLGTSKVSAYSPRPGQVDLRGRGPVGHVEAIFCETLGPAVL